MSTYVVHIRAKLFTGIAGLMRLPITYRRIFHTFFFQEADTVPNSRRRLVVNGKDLQVRAESEAPSLT